MSNETFFGICLAVVAAFVFVMIGSTAAQISENRVVRDHYFLTAEQFATRYPKSEKGSQ